MISWKTKAGFLPRKPVIEDYRGRFRDIIGDPLNLLIRHCPMAGTVDDNGLVTLHNGHTTYNEGPNSYYEGYTDILIVNRGVSEPLEEFIFQRVLTRLEGAPTMLELGSFWAHYSAWMKQQHSDAVLTMVEENEAALEAGKDLFARHGYQGEFIKQQVAPGRFEVDQWMADKPNLTILHCDIQGGEEMMLHRARETLAMQKIDYLFISTHSPDLHARVCGILRQYDYRVEVNSDLDQTTAYDGLLVATAKRIQPLVDVSWYPWSRNDIYLATPADRLKYLNHTANAWRVER